MGSEKFCLRWNDFESNISSAFCDLRQKEQFFDITLACDDEQIKAHKVILSACSPFFHKILQRNPHESPLLYLKGVKFSDLQSVLNFMYNGEVNVPQEELKSFLAVAEDLKVKGLSENISTNPTLKISDLKCRDETADPMYIEYNATSEILKNNNDNVFSDGCNDTTDINYEENYGWIKTEVDTNYKAIKSVETLEEKRIRTENKKSETIRKQQLYQEGINSYLSGESPSLYAVAKRMGLNYSTLYQIFTVGGTYKAKGRKSTVFTEEEEKGITEKVLASSNNGKDLTWDMLRNMLVKEAELLMVANPDRDIMRISATSGTIMNKSFVRRFAQRNYLSEFLLKKYTLTDRPFRCEECNLGFTFKNILVKHLKTKHIKNESSSQQSSTSTGLSCSEHFQPSFS